LRVPGLGTPEAHNSTFEGAHSRIRALVRQSNWRITVTVTVQTDPDFAFTGLETPTGDPAQVMAAVRATPQQADPLGPLAQLPGTWKGHGFNAIWRPHHPADQQDRFLELNVTDETLVFTRINGPIPNRGLAMPDINMFCT
jgi:hypothetical protein